MFQSGPVVLGRWDFWNCGHSDCGLHWFTYLFCSPFTPSLSVWGVLVWLRRPLYSLFWDPSWTQHYFPFKHSSVVLTVVTCQLYRLWFPWVHELVTLCRRALRITLYGSCDLSESSEAGSPWEPYSGSVDQEIFAWYGTRSFLTIFTRFIWGLQLTFWSTFLN